MQTGSVGREFDWLQVKCEQYWPRKVGETLTLDGGNLTVQLREIIPYADYELRKIIISDVSIHVHSLCTSQVFLFAYVIMKVITCLYSWFSCCRVYFVAGNR